MEISKAEQLDNPVIAALIGFLSGAGVMSHVDLLQIWTNELVDFIQITNAGVNIHGRQMIAIIIAMVAYFMVLLIIGIMTFRIALKTNARYVRMLAAIGFLLIISFFGTSIFAVNRGYYRVEKELQTMRDQKTQVDEKLDVRWVWK